MFISSPDTHYCVRPVIEFVSLSLCTLFTMPRFLWIDHHLQVKSEAFWIISGFRFCFEQRLCQSHYIGALKHKAFDIEQLQVCCQMCVYNKDI